MPSNHVIRGARTHNLKNIDLDPARPADRDHRPVRLGQVLARVRHDLRRGPAPLRRVAVGLRAAVPVDDGKARRRPHRGPVAGDRDRAEVDLAQPALDRRHGHRDLRLPAPAVRARRHAALPGPRHRPRGADRQPDGRPGAGAAGEARDACCSRRVVRTARASTRRCFEQLRSQGFVRARIDGERHRARRRRRSSTRDSKHTIEAVVDRLKRARRRRRSGWPNRSRRRCALARRRGARRVHGRAEARAAGVLGQVRLPDLRLQPRRSSSRGCSRSTTRAAPARTCDGLGVQQFFDPARVVVASASVARRRRDPRLGPPQRVLLPADPVARASTTTSTSRRRGATCRKRSSRCVLYGSGDEQIEFRYFDARGGT